jgi:hypothetical protein
VNNTHPVYLNCQSRHLRYVLLAFLSTYSLHTHDTGTDWLLQSVPTLLMYRLCKPRSRHTDNITDGTSDVLTAGCQRLKSSGMLHCEDWQIVAHVSKYLSITVYQMIQCNTPEDLNFQRYRFLTSDRDGIYRSTPANNKKQAVTSAFTFASYFNISFFLSPTSFYLTMIGVEGYFT